jgi:heme exporter protein D
MIGSMVIIPIFDVFPRVAYRPNWAPLEQSWCQYLNVHTFSRYIRWAVILPLLQLAIFAAIGLQEHRKYLALNSRSQRIHNLQWFGCIPLQRARISEADQLTMSWGDCWTSPPVKYAEISNLPVFVVWLGVIAELTSNHAIDQLPLFYATNLIGISFLWFGIGKLVDRIWRLRSPSSPIG